MALLLLDISPLSHWTSDQLSAARQAREENLPHLAAAFLRSAVMSEPWRTELWEQIGLQEMASGQLDSAFEALLTAQRLGELSGEGKFALGELYAQQGDNAKAKRIWQELLGEISPEARLYEKLVHVARDQRDWSSVVDLLYAWQRLEPENPRITYLLGLHLSVFDPEKALPYLIDAAQQDTKLTEPVQTLRRAVNQGSTSGDAGYSWLLLGRALASIGHWELAETSFQRAVEASPAYGDAWAFLGEARFQNGQDGKAELEKAQSLAPDSAIVRAMLAFYWRRAGEPDRALEHIEAAARLEPEEAIWQVELGNIWVQKGDLVSALTYYQRAVELSPKLPLYWQELARFSVQHNMDIQGIGLPAARQALLLAPDDPECLDLMGWTLMHVEDYTSAERFLQRAVEMDPALAAAHLHLGQLYLQQQDAVRAYQYLQRASQLDEHNSVGQIARRLLSRYYNEGG